MNNCYQKVLTHFQGNKIKTDLWFQLPNPELHNMSPNDLIKCGQEKKLENTIDAALIIKQEGE